MSKDANKSEPSMEDILASIRRIIDEDGGRTKKAAAASPGDKAGPDVLELTEMVNEDGSVTSLDKAPAIAAVADQASRLLDDDEPPIYADRGERDRPAGFVPPETMRPGLAGESRPQPTQPPASPPIGRDAPPRQSQPAPQPAQSSRISPTPALGGGISLTPVNTTSGTSSGQSELVSNQTANATSAAFDRLVQAASQQAAPAAAAAPRPPSPTVGGRALEDMVAEMLRPMLKQWLDANLPSVVERLVQQEIQKMTRR